MNMFLTPCGCCGNCYVCVEDNFDRANATSISGAGAPLNWSFSAASNYFSVFNNECKITGVGLAIAEEQVNWSDTFESIARIELVSATQGDAIGLAVSYVHIEDYYWCQYDYSYGGDGTLKIYKVYNGGLTLLNENLVGPLSALGAPAYLEATINLEAGLIQVAIKNSVGSGAAIVAPYWFNGGTRAGFGVKQFALPNSTVTIDDFRRCDNQCESDCVFGVDTFQRAFYPSTDVGSGYLPGWVENPRNTGGVQDAYSQVIWGGLEGGIVYFENTSTMYHKAPHPDGHQSMWVGGKVYLDSAQQIPNIYYRIPKVTLYACVNNTGNPTSYIEAIFDMHWTGSKSVTINRVLNNVGKLICTDSVFNGTLGPSWNYVSLCVSDKGTATCYAVNDTAETWIPLCGGYIGADLSLESGIQGTYTGVKMEASSGIRWGYLDNYFAIKSYHIEQEGRYQFDVAGTIESGDLFTIEVTKWGNVESISYTASGVTPSVGTVTSGIQHKLRYLPPLTYPVFSTINWIFDFSMGTGKFYAYDDSDFTITVTTSDSGGANPADTQTFAVTGIQTFIAGASGCPVCPSFCSPCTYCSGLGQYGLFSLITPDQGPTQDARNPGVCFDWDNAIPPTPYHDFPVNNPRCTGTARIACEMLNGTYLLEGCDCGLVFVFPIWQQYYYNNSGGTPSAPGHGTGIYNNDNNAETCYPGSFCNGFVLRANLTQDFSYSPFKLKWHLSYEDTGEVGTYVWTSEAFDNDGEQCMTGRTCYGCDVSGGLSTPNCLGTVLDISYCTPPKTVYWEPIGVFDPFYTFGN